YSVSTDKPKRYPFSLSKKNYETFHLHLSISPTISYGTVSSLKRSVSPPVLLLLNRSLSPPPFSALNIRMFLWAEFRDPRFYPSSCESLPSIATIGGLTEAARLGTSQAELKGGTTRAPIIYEATNCSLYIGREKMAMYGSVVTLVWCNGDGHGNQSDDSPDMDVIGISGKFLLYVIDNFFSDINKLVAVNCIEGHGSSLGRFKSHASNIVFDEHRENILPSSEGDVGLAASSGPSVLGDKVDEECAAADPPEISDAQNNRKRCRE
ncbi:hypothetical protein HID58_046160, partial [Brassica napus]